MLPKRALSPNGGQRSRRNDCAIMSVAATRERPATWHSERKFAMQDQATTRAVSAHFWARVDSSNGEDSCWPWTGFCLPKGYGKTSHRGKDITSHRLAYTLAHGHIPDGMHVLHSCDNPPCCNPAHLHLGTNLDNIAEMRAKLRHNFGERNGSAKLTDDDIRAIRASTEPQRAIAKRYGVVQQTISAIKTGAKWRHVS